MNTDALMFAITMIVAVAAFVALFCQDTEHRD